jgi:hypothetical protein
MLKVERWKSTPLNWGGGGGIGYFVQYTACQTRFVLKLLIAIGCVYYSV